VVIITIIGHASKFDHNLIVHILLIFILFFLKNYFNYLHTVFLDLSQIIFNSFVDLFILLTQPLKICIYKFKLFFFHIELKMLKYLPFVLFKLVKFALFLQTTHNRTDPTLILSTLFMLQIYSFDIIKQFKG